MSETDTTAIFGQSCYAMNARALCILVKCQSCGDECTRGDSTANASQLTDDT